MKLNIITIFILLIIFTIFINDTKAIDIDISWKQSKSHHNFKKYRIYWGDKPGIYTHYKEVPRSVTSTTITNLAQKKTYYFAATTVASSGQESPYSNEVHTYLDADIDQSGFFDQQATGVYDANHKRTDTDNGIDDEAELADWRAAWSRATQGDGLAHPIHQNANGAGIDNSSEPDARRDPSGPDRFSSGEGDGRTSMTFWIEAEEHDGDNFSPFEVVEDDAASCGAYIEAPPRASAYKTPPSDGHAEYDFTLPEAAPIAIWLRVRVPASNPSSHTSFWVNVTGDERGWGALDVVDKGSDWHWVEWDEGMDDTHLEAGDHTLTIAYREDGIFMDKLLVTTDLSFYPESRSESDCHFSRRQPAGDQQHHNTNLQP